MSVNYHASQSRGVPFSDYEAVSGQWRRTFSNYDPARIAGILHLTADDRYLWLSYFGKPYRLRLADGCLEKQKKGQWTEALFFNEAMAIYHLLNYTKDAPTVSGEWVPNYAVDGVASRKQAAPDPLLDPFARAWSGKVQELAKACAKAGGKPIGKGDVGFQFEAFPTLQLQLVYWDADEDFPAQTQVFVDRCVTDFVHYETVGCIIADLFDRLEEASAAEIQCIALDLDHTTLNSRGRLSRETRRALEYAIGRGVHIVVASGRAFRSLPAEICEITGIQYAVTSNGAAVWDLQTGRCLKQYKLTEQAVREILRLTEGIPLALEAFIDGKPYAQEDYVADPAKYGARSVAYVQNTREPVPRFREFLLQNCACLDCVDLVIGSVERRDQMWKLLASEVPDVYITSSSASSDAQLLEISYKDCGKHSGVKFVLDQLGLSPASLAAFGDGDNDAQMLAFAGVGVAVANASSACKAAADRITLSNDEDGVALEIFRLLDAD